MLTGPELGKALEAAMAAKGVVQREVATEFGIKQPSVSEWLKLSDGTRLVAGGVDRFRPHDPAFDAAVLIHR